VTCNTKQVTELLLPSARELARVSRVRRQMQRCFYAGPTPYYPPTPGHHGGYSESQQRGKSTNRDNLQVRSGESGNARLVNPVGRSRGPNTPDRRTAASFISTTRCWHVMRLSKGPPIFLLALEYSLRHWTSRKSK
jgi:hypothetical protein